MERLAKELAKKGTVYSFDLLGFGKSPRPKRCNYSLDDHTQALFNSVTELGLKEFELVGHSMGSVVAVSFAEAYPRLVSGLYLSALPLLNQQKPYKQLHDEYPGTRFMTHGLSGFVFCTFHKLLPKTFAKQASKRGKNLFPNHPEEVFADTFEHSWRSFNRSMKHTVIKHEAYKKLADLEVPITLFYGKKDQITKGHNNKLKQLKLQSTVVDIDAHHDMPLTHSKILARHILR